MINPKIFSFFCVLAFLAVPQMASAQETETKALVPFTGIKVGPTLHSVFTQLDPWAAVEIEGGISLLHRRLDVAISLGWARPPAEKTATDERFENGDYAWELSQDFLMFSILGRYRFLYPAGPYNVYAAAGPRIFLMRTVVNGQSGQESTGENTQTETRFGGVLLAGGEYRLGPGALLLEAGFGLGNLEGLITGEVQSSDLFLLFGYRLHF